MSARNPFPYPVIARLPWSGDAGPSASFSYRFDGRAESASYDLRAEVPEDSEFAASATKRLLFDFHVGPGSTRYDIPPGTFLMKGAYGEVGSPTALALTLSSADAHDAAH